MPDDMDANYGLEYPHQPYNGNPHMHPGEQTLIRVIGQGRWQHPFHEHANHVRILGRDGNLITTPDKKALAGLLMFTTDTDSGPGLRWDLLLYGPRAELGCVRSQSVVHGRQRQTSLHSRCERLQHWLPSY